MEEGADMHSLLLTDNNTVLMAGLQNYVTEVDLSTVQETQKVRTSVYIECVCCDIHYEIKVFLSLSIGSPSLSHLHLNTLSYYFCCSCFKTFVFMYLV